MGLKDKREQIHIYTAHFYSQEVLVFLEILEALAVPRRKLTTYVLNSMVQMDEQKDLPRFY